MPKMVLIEKTVTLSHVHFVLKIYKIIIKVDNFCDFENPPVRLFFFATINKVAIYNIFN